MIRAMKAATFLALLVFPVVALSQSGINKTCAAGGDPSSYVQVHGRLGVYNGGYPNLRIWHIGTNHIFGIFGDPADLRCQRTGKCDGDQDTNLPSNLDRLMRLPNPLFEYWVYGDFRLRPLEPFQPGHQQAACIVSADHLFRAKSD